MKARRLISWIMALAMIVSMMNVGVLASDETDITDTPVVTEDTSTPTAETTAQAEDTSSDTGNSSDSNVQVDENQPAQDEQNKNVETGKTESADEQKTETPVEDSNTENTDETKDEDKAVGGEETPAADSASSENPVETPTEDTSSDDKEENTGNSEKGEFAELTETLIMVMSVEEGKGTSNVKIGEQGYNTLADALEATKEMSGDVVIELFAAAELSYGAREAYGSDDTKSITINGNGNTLTLNQTDSDWSSIGMANEDGVFKMNDVTVNKTGYGATSGTWNTHAIIFNVNTEFKDVTFNNSIEVSGTSVLTNVDVVENGGYYGIWIPADAESVTISGGSITATNGGRGIKIADEYVDAPAEVKLTVDGMTFNTAEKAAVLVSSTAGADITATNCDISKVAADSTNFAWVDEDWSSSADKVTVNDESVFVEGAIVINDIDELKTFRDAVNAGDKYEGEYVMLANDIDLAGENWTPIGLDGDGAGFAGTFDGQNHVISNLNVDTVGGEDCAAGLFGSVRGTLKNFTVKNANVKNLVTEDPTVDGTAVVAGCTGYGATIDNVHVDTATVESNRYVGGISGYAAGSFTNCSVKNVTITATPNEVSEGEYDNGDKVGGIIGYVNSYDTTIDNCELSGENTINAYRDIGGIVGCVNDQTTLKDNEVAGKLTINVDTTLCGERDSYNVGLVYGRNTPATESGSVSDEVVYEVEVKTAPKGSNSYAYTKEVDGYVRVWGEGGGNASESYALKLYSGETLIATTVLNNVGGIIDGDVYVTWNFFYPSSNDPYWTTTWEEGHPNSAAQPTSVELIIDGTVVATTAAKMSGADNVNPVVWEELGGVKKAVTGLSGTGTEEDPYLINNIDELKWFRDKVDEQAQDGSSQYAGKYIKLTADIDLAGENWNPIGTMSGDKGSFKGVFNGDGHTISNLNVQQAGNGIGFFARTAGNAEIKNLTFNNVTVKSTDNSNYVGAVVGNSYASTKITNVHVTGAIDISGRGYIGGISGHGYVVMDNVSVIGEGTISSTFWCAGGILGYAGEGVTNITNSKVEGTGETGLTITSAAGGLGAIVGMAEDNEGTQPISGSNLSAKNVDIKTYTGAYGDAYANYALGYLYGGNSTSILTGTLSAEDVDITTSNGVEPKVQDVIAFVGDAFFFNLASAIEAAKDGGIVVLNRDVVPAVAITVPDGAVVTLDLNGKTLNGSILAPNADLTVKNGSIVNTNTDVSGIEINAGKLALTDVNIDSSRHAVRIDGEVTATINGGTYRSAINDGTKTLHAVNVSGGANVVIEDGEFVGPKGTTADSGAAVCVQEGTTVKIYGGSFSGGKNNLLLTKETAILTIYGGTFDQDPSAYCAEGYAAIADLNGNYIVGVKPTATVNNLGAKTIEEYTVYGGSLSGALPLSFVMQFIADQDEEDMETSPFADWYGDFVITFTGIENDSFTADGCYLAGFYGDFGWVVIPVDGMTIKEGVRYPVMLGVGMGQKYDYICSGVQDFKCALYITPEILEANPDLTVNLELAVVDNSNGQDAATEAVVAGKSYKVTDYNYKAEDFVIPDPVAKIGDVEYTSFEEAVAEAESGDTITLLADIELAEQVVIDKSINLDLNEKTISASGALYRPIKITGNNADITVKISNGSIVVSDVTTKPEQSATLLVYEGADVTLEDVTVKGENYSVMLAGYDSYGTGVANNNTTSLYVNDGTVLKAENAAIISQGAYPNTYIEINEGAEVTSTGSIAIYYPTKGKLVVNGGEVTGTSGICIKAGSLEVNGGTIVANGEAAEHEFVDSGATSTGDAIIVESLDYGYYGAPEVKIIGGTIKSVNGEAVVSYAKDGYELVTGFISGGTFSSDVTELCADGYEAVANDDGTYGIEEAEVELPAIILGGNVALGNSLTMNFYIDSTLVNDDDYVIIEHIFADGRASEIVEQAIAECKNNMGSGYPRATINTIAAKEMADTVEVVVCDANGTQKSQKFTYSIRQYAMNQLNKTSDEKLKITIVDMLNYGAAAQTYFKYNTADLANNQLTSEQAALATTTFEVTNANQVLGANAAGTTLSLESNILLSAYFKKIVDSAEGMKAVASFTDHYGNEKTETITDFRERTISGTKYIVVDLTSLVVADMKQPVDVVVYNADGSEYGTGTFSIETYVANNSSNIAVNALAKFATSTYNYFHK